MANELEVARLKRHVAELEKHVTQLEGDLAATKDGLAEALAIGARDIQVGQAVTGFLYRAARWEELAEQARSFEFQRDANGLAAKRSLMTLIVEMRKVVSVYEGGPGAPKLEDYRETCQAVTNVIDIVLGQWQADVAQLNDDATKIYAAQAEIATSFFDKHRRMAKVCSTFFELESTKGIAWKPLWVIPQADIDCYWQNGKFHFRAADNVLINSLSQKPVTLYGYQIVPGSRDDCGSSGTTNPKTYQSTWTLHAKDAYGCEIGIYLDQPTEVYTRAAMSPVLLAQLQAITRHIGQGSRITPAMMPQFHAEVSRAVRQYEITNKLVTVGKVETRLADNGEIFVDIVPALLTLR